MRPSFWRRIPGDWHYMLRVFGREPEDDVDAELRFHFDERIAELSGQGISPEAARAKALREFGDVAAVREHLHDIDHRIAERRRRADWKEHLANDVLIAIRRLRRSPAFTIAATLTLALAIGATASVFSVVDGVVLRAVPLEQPDRLLLIYESNAFHHLPRFSSSPMNFLDWQAENHSFTALAALQQRHVTVTGSGDPERLATLAVTANLFEVAGVLPVLGRPLTADSIGSPEVVISHEYWARHFGSATSVIGQSILLDNVATTIVGVLPTGTGIPGDMWTQLSLNRATLPRRDYHYISTWGRLKPGVTAEAGTRDLQTIAARLAREYPQTNENWSVVTVPFREALVGPVQRTLIIILFAAGCVLLIGVANLANLFLVRFLARQREVAVRIALGATRAQVIREPVIEAAIIAFGASAIGIGVAFVGVRILRTLAPPTFPRIAEIGVDGPVLTFCAVTSIAAAFIFGVFPAWQASRGRPDDALREGARGTGSARAHRLQGGLVVVQVAVAFVLLAGAGLLIETFVHFQRTELGFNPQGVLTADVSLPAKRYATPELMTAFASSVVDQLGSEPGVEAAGVSSSLPGNSGWRESFTIIGDPSSDPAKLPNAHAVFVTPEYFRAMGIRVTRGRGVRTTDDRRAVKIAVIDEALARRAFANRNPIGLRMALLGPDADTVEIVGISSTAKQGGLVAEDVPWFYMSLAQAPAPGFVGEIVLRTTNDPMAHAPALRRAVGDIDKTVPLSNLEPMTARVTQSIDATRFSTFLASLFAGVALILSLIGIYSVLAYVVAQRRREIAIRLALGARQSHVIQSVLRHAIVLAAAGIAIGYGAAWWLSAALDGLIEGVSPHDPAVFVVTAVAFVAVAVVAAAVPAFRTTRVNPATVLTSG